MSTNVFIRAVNVGTAGNSITLTFDGVDDIDTVLAAWNAANTSNTAELVSGNGSQIPDDLEEITLSGGGAAGSDPIAAANPFDQDLNTTDDPTFNKLTLTPDQNDSSLKLGTLEFQSYSTNNAWIGDNVYLDGSNFKRRNSGAATLFYFQGEEGQFRSDVSDDAGTNVTILPNFKVGAGGKFSAGGPNVSNQGDFENGALWCDGDYVGLSDTADETKKVEFDVSGVTTETTRTLEIPDANGKIALQGAITTSGLTQATARILGRTSSSTGSIEELAASDVRTFLNTDESTDTRDPNLHAASHLAGTPAVAASYTGIGSNETFSEEVTIIANTAGTAGNSITLTFDGVDDVDTVLAAWNTANPSNQATLDSGDGGQVPDDGDSLTLSGGAAATGGSDPFANINQDLGTQDKPTFDGLVIGEEVGGYVQGGAHRSQIVATGTQTPLTIIGGSGSIEFYKDVNASKVVAFGFAVPGNAAGNNLVFSDYNGGWSAIFEAPKNAPLDIKTGGVKFADATDNSKKVELSAASVSSGQTRVLTAPNASGTIALSSQVFDFYYATAPSGATGGSGSVWVWNIPSWSTMQVITMIGAGGGGGSGRVGASGTVCGGGGAGGGGSYGTFITRITGGDQIEVLVGAGGAGGAAAGTGNGNGLSGTAGGNTSVRWVTPNITLRTSTGFGAGSGGGGGTATFGTAGTAGVGVASPILGSGGSGGAGIAGSVTGNAGGGSNSNSTQGGRAGGSIDATPTAFNGGAVLGSSFTDIRESFLLPNLSPKIGTGAKGGNASTTANAQAGDNAGGLGGGGGGGGAALTGFLSGAGGNGGNAFVRINCF
jgi:hypothetical protein